MSWANTLISDYYDWLKKQTIIKPDEKSEWVEIQTPYIGLFNDNIEIYANRNQNNILLSDNGDTFNNLELVGANLAKNSERYKIAEKIFLNYGIKIKNNELISETTVENFSQKKHNFLSAIMELNDLYMLSKSNVTSIFKEDVRAFLEKKDIIFTPEFISKGSTGLEFMFDFQIAGRKNELVIKSFNTINKQTIASFLFSWDDIKPIREKFTHKKVSAIAIINDEDKKVKSEYIDAFQSKNAKVILWSKREESEVSEILTAA